MDKQVGKYNIETAGGRAGPCWVLDGPDSSTKYLRALISLNGDNHSYYYLYM